MLASPTVWPAEFVGVYRAERTNLVRAAYLICGSRSLAEDAVHDAVVRVAPRWDTLEKARSYLYVSVVNAARDIVRRSQRQLAQEPADDRAVAELGADSIALRDALAALPERQRTAIVLRFFLDWPDDEIARQLHARPGTVRSLIHRGIASLREELDA